MAKGYETSEESTLLKDSSNLNSNNEDFIVDVDNNNSRTISYYYEGEQQPFHTLTIHESNKVLLSCFGNERSPIIRIPESSDDEEKVCRICYETKGELISPCMCSGSMKHIHRNCLNEWRSQTTKNEYFSKCETCNQYYVLDFQTDCVEKASKLFKLKVILDIFTLLTIALFIILGFIVVTEIINATAFPFSPILPDSFQSGIGRYFWVILMGIILCCASVGMFGIIFGCCVCFMDEKTKFVTKTLNTVFWLVFPFFFLYKKETKNRKN